MQSAKVKRGRQKGDGQISVVFCLGHRFANDEMSRCAQASPLATKALIHSLALPGGVWQAVCCNAQVSQAGSGCAFSVCLPCCTHQGARYRAPQLGAGGPFGEGIGSALSDKEFKSVVNSPVEDGLGPGGRPAKLFQYHWCHPSIQRLEVVTISLSICPAFRHFFSEKFLADVEVNIDGVDLHVQPELRAVGFNNVYISTVNGPDTARGRLSIRLELIRDERGLLSGGRQACLPGKFGNEVPDTVMSPGMQAFGATCSMSAIRIKNVLAALSPRGGAATLLSRPGGGESESLVEAKAKDWIQEGVLPLAGQAMEPLSMAMVAFRPGRRITW